METVLALVRDYGMAVYVLLFAYCALKSGSLPLFAWYAAQTGALDVATVAAATFAGGYLGDEARFAVARRYGHRLSTGRPRMARLIARGTDLLDRYGLIYLFLYRTGLSVPRSITLQGNSRASGSAPDLRASRQSARSRNR
jgi:membrane-associated protein